MPSLAIPERHLLAIRIIARLDTSTLVGIRGAIESIASVAGAGTITSLLTPLFSDLGIESPELVAEAISSLYRVKWSKELPTDEFCAAVATGFDSTGSEKENLKRNLVILLSVDELGITAKAWNLQSDHEHTFCDAKIITDLRPVFGSDIDEGPKAMTLIHFLKLGYHQHGSDNPHREFYLALDAEDLDTLHEIVSRAKRKADSLKSRITEVPYMARS